MRDPQRAVLGPAGDNWTAVAVKDWDGAARGAQGYAQGAAVRRPWWHFLVEDHRQRRVRRGSARLHPSHVPATHLSIRLPICRPASAHTNSLSCRCPGFHVSILSRCRPTVDAARNKTLYLGHPYSRVQWHASPPGICCIVDRLLDEVLRMPNCARNPHLLAHQSTA